MAITKFLIPVLAVAATAAGKSLINLLSIVHQSLLDLLREMRVKEDCSISHLCTDISTKFSLTRRTRG